jgi:type II secretory pathway pseudopilin PulG
MNAISRNCTTEAHAPSRTLLRSSDLPRTLRLGAVEPIGKQLLNQMRRLNRKCQQGHTARRTGFSLIEVIIATAILMGSAVVLSRLAGMGREQSQKASLHAKAQELCEQTMGELLLQMRPPELVETMPLTPLPWPFEETQEESGESSLFAEAQVPQETALDEVNPEWRYSVRMDLLPNLPGMWSLTVVVVQGDETLERPVRFSLTRWISGPPPEGAFDDLTRGINDSSLPDQGGFL